MASDTEYYKTVGNIGEGRGWRFPIPCARDTEYYKTVGNIGVKKHCGFWKLFFLANGKRIAGTRLWMTPDGAIGEAMGLDAPWLKAEADRMTKIVESVRVLNPYPADVFVEPSEEQCAAVHKWLVSQGGTLDGLAGSIGRRVWDNCCAKILEEMQEAMEDGE